MKKVINGKVYDTDKAVLIARADHDNIKDAYGMPCRQVLFRKKTGEFFLYLEQGTSLTLNNILGGDYRHGRGIYPLTYGQAQMWSEAEMSADAWENLFGDPEDDSDILIGIRVSASAAAKLKRIAAETGKPQNRIVEELINNM